MKKVLFIFIGIVIGAICTTFVFMFNYKKDISCTNRTSLIEDSLKQQIVKYGNHDAYRELSILCLPDDELCFPTQKHYDILFYDLLMAEKYDDMYACYEVYLLLFGYKENNMFANSKNTEIKELALYYLRKGSDLGHYNCADIIYNLLKDNKLPRQDWKPMQYYKERADSLRSVMLSPENLE